MGSPLKFLSLLIVLGAFQQAFADTKEKIFYRLEGAGTYEKVQSQGYLPTKADVESIKAGFTANLAERRGFVETKVNLDKQRITKASAYYRALLNNSQLSAKSRSALQGILAEVPEVLVTFESKALARLEMFTLADNRYLAYLDKIWQYLDAVEKKAATLDDPELKEGYLLLAQRDLRKNYGPLWRSFVSSFETVRDYILGWNQLIPLFSITKYLRTSGSNKCSYESNLAKWPLFEQEAATALFLTGSNFKKEPAIVYCEEHPTCTNTAFPCPKYPVTYSSSRNYLTLHTYLYTGWGYYRVESAKDEILANLH